MASNSKMIYGFGFCASAHWSSHVIAAARDANRCLNRKSSSFFSREVSTKKFSSGFELGTPHS